MLLLRPWLEHQILSHADKAEGYNVRVSQFYICYEHTYILIQSKSPQIYSFTGKKTSLWVLKLNVRQPFPPRNNLWAGSFNYNNTLFCLTQEYIWGMFLVICSCLCLWGGKHCPCIIKHTLYATAFHINLSETNSWPASLEMVIGSTISVY